MNRSSKPTQNCPTNLARSAPVHSRPFRSRIQHRPQKVLGPDSVATRRQDTTAENRSPVIAGIQTSDTPASIHIRPTSLTTPLATMYEQLSPASTNSESLLPPSTGQQVPRSSPTARPFSRIASSTFQLDGTTAKTINADCAQMMRTTRTNARLARPNSEQTLMPITLDSV